MNLILAIFGGIALFHGLFMGFYLIKISKAKNPSNIFLGALLISFSLRIGKSIFYFLLGNDILSSFGVALGLVGMLSIGPFICLYVQSMLNKSFVWQRAYLLHFIPAFLAISFSWLTKFWSGFQWFYVGYRPAAILMAIYLGFAWYSWYNLGERADQKVRRWVWVCLSASSLIWLSFAYQFFAGGLFTYSLGSLWATLILYWLFYEGLNNSKVFEAPKIKKKKSLPKDIQLALKKKLQNAFEEKKIYRDSSLTLSNLARQLDTPSYLISQTINKEYRKSFPEFVNSYRIQEVKEKLLAAKDDFVKIEALAYEVGFNTPSAFYSAFRKSTGCTPQEFKKQHPQTDSTVLKNDF